MNYRLGLLVSLGAATAGLLVGGLIIFTIDPTTADVLTKLSLFVSFFLLLAGFAIPALFWSKVTVGNREVVFAIFPIAVRQGILLSILFTGLLILQSIRGLSWWDAILVAAGVGFVELAFRSRS